MLNLEEQHHKEEVVSFTEQVSDAKGIECDSKISEEQLREILEQVRKLRKRKKNEEDNERQLQEELDISVQ